MRRKTSIEPDHQARIIAASAIAFKSLLHRTHFILRKTKRLLDIDIFPGVQSLYHLRGMGLAIFPMIMSLMGVCVFRIVWLYTFFAANPTLATLFWSYPISWIMTMAFMWAANLYVTRNVLPKKLARL